MAIVSSRSGQEITVHAGLQPKQYLEQLRAAGMLAVALAAAGVERRQMGHALSRLVHAFRLGEVSAESKAAAAKLHLNHYPDGVRNLEC